MYINIVTKEYPRHDGDMELLGWSVGESLPEKWSKVQEVPPPEITSGQVVREGLPILINNVWTQQWETHVLTEEELSWIETNKQKAFSEHETPAP
jgi:hypothetical protein